VAAICEDSSLPDFEVCQLLWALHVVGAVRREAPAAVGAPEDEGLDEVLAPTPYAGRDTARVAAGGPETLPALALEGAHPLAVADAGASWLPSQVPTAPAAAVVLPEFIDEVPQDAEPAPAESGPGVSRQRVVLAALSDEFRRRLDPLLGRSSFEVETAASGAAALAACGHARVDLLMTSHRLPDMPLQQLVKTLCSAQRVTHVVVVAEPAELPALRRSLGSSEVAVLLDEPGRLLDEIAARLLGAPRRVSLRLMVRIDVKVDDSRQRLMCQSENLSTAGVFLRTAETYPLGTQLNVEFTLPGDRNPILVQSEVVRHARPESEKLAGMGLRFCSFKGDGLARVQEYCTRAAATGS
jgi:uncharacterized protein (TIGR02266 family)